MMLASAKSMAGPAIVGRICSDIVKMDVFEEAIRIWALASLEIVCIRMSSLHRHAHAR
jgi:hypothetical protein